MQRLSDLLITALERRFPMWYKATPHKFVGVSMILFSLALLVRPLGLAPQLIYTVFPLFPPPVFAASYAICGIILIARRVKPIQFMFLTAPILIHGVFTITLAVPEETLTFYVGLLGIFAWLLIGGIALLTNYWRAKIELEEYAKGLMEQMTNDT